MVAGDFAAAYPQLIDGLILVSSAGYFPPCNAMKPTPWAFVNRIGLWVTSLDYWGNQMLRALGLDPHKVPVLARQRMRYGWRRAREMARMGQFYDTPGFVSKIRAAKVPTAAIHGDRDVLFPLPKVLETVAGAFPVLVEQGAGHLPYDYDLLRFTQLLRETAQLVIHEPIPS
jgi:pimeloyl-ACP methyl ester carboxylesterase